MSMVCPQCKRSHDHVLECPQCRVRLLYHASAFEPNLLAREDNTDSETRWQKTPWAKILVGLLLTQGLCYGLQNLTQAAVALHSSEGASDTVWRTLGGLILSHSLQALSLLVGGALSGAGQRHGVWYGCFLGLANGLITLVVQRRDLQVAAPLQIFTCALPLLHMILGALGGLIGTLIWRPTPVLVPGESSAQAVPVPSTSLFSVHLLSGPMHIWRISAGVVIVVFGFGWSSAILQSVVEFSGGSLTITSHLQASLVSWEIAALAALIGAGFAGANTFNGLKQGLCVGVGAAIVFAMMQVANPKAVAETVVLTVISIVVLAVAGGWFGGQLFPPVLRRRPRLTSYA
jgi:hypothetical protein